jgi:hypothetical protein
MEITKAIGLKCGKFRDSGGESGRKGIASVYEQISSDETNPDEALENPSPLPL